MNSNFFAVAQFHILFPFDKPACEMEMQPRSTTGQADTFLSFGWDGNDPDPVTPVHVF